MFKNSKALGIRFSRFIASWNNVGGRKLGDDAFLEWLESIGVSEEDRYAILEMKNTGKLELEASAKDFIIKH